MNFLGIQVLTAFVSFAILVVVGAAPFCLITCKLRRSSRRNRRHSEDEPAGGVSLLSLSNCFACGIFLSACFIGLVPHVRHESLMLKAMLLNSSITLDEFVHGHETESLGSKLVKLPDTELLLVLGFVFIMVLEQLVAFCGMCGKRRRRKKRSDDDNGWLGNMEFEPLDEETSGKEIEFRVIEEAEKEEERPRINFQSIMLLFGLGIHAVFEGLAIGLQNTEDNFVRLTTAVLLHEVLCVFAFGLSLAKQKASLGYGFISVVVLSLAIPVGMLVGIPVPKSNSFSTTLVRYLLEGLASGIFVYVACVEMLSGELMSGGGHGHSHVGQVQEEASCVRSKACVGLVKALTVGAGVIAFLIVALFIA